MSAIEKGLLFRPDMIRALLNTQPDVWPAQPIDPSRPFKFQTRRTLNPQPEFRGSGDSWHWAGGTALLRAGYGAPYVHTDRCAMERAMLKVAPHPVGSLIYAKEKHSISGNGYYFPDQCDGTVKHAWKSSLYMPKDAARLWFEVMAVRGERVNAIENSDCLAEGIAIPDSVRRACELNAGAGEFDTIDWDPTEDYKTLWDSINGKGSFDKGPWVWVYSLKRITHKPTP